MYLKGCYFLYVIYYNYNIWKKMYFLCDMFYFIFEKIVMIYMDVICDLYLSIYMFFVFYGVWLFFYWDGDWNNWIYKVYRNSLEK